MRRALTQFFLEFPNGIDGKIKCFPCKWCTWRLAEARDVGHLLLHTDCPGIMSQVPWTETKTNAAGQADFLWLSSDRACEQYSTAFCLTRKAREGRKAYLESASTGSLHFCPGRTLLPGSYSTSRGRRCGRRNPYLQSRHGFQ